MRRSAALLILAVGVPGVLSPFVWRALRPSADVHTDVVLTLRADGAPPVVVRAPRPPAPPVPPVAPIAPVPPTPPLAPAPPVRPERARPAVAPLRAGYGDAGECRYENVVAGSRPASAADRLELRAGSGSLDVRGVRGLEEVRWEARLCASDEDFLADMGVDVDGSRGTVRVETLHPDPGGFSWGRRYAMVHLTVEVPLRMAADIEDSSGSMRVSGTGALDVRDRSGDVEIREVDGPVTLRDGSGGIVLRDVGDVELEDGSGPVDIRDAASVTVLHDGSGGIDVVDVSGDVRVLRDGSGSIDVMEVDGDFVVERDGSGHIRWDRVAGRVEVPRDKR